MNWKSDSLKSLGWKTALLGAVAGFWGGLLYEAAQTTVTVLAGGEEGIGAWLLVPPVLLGLGMGALLTPVEDLLYRVFSRAAFSALLGGLLAALAALVLAGVLMALRGPLPLLDTLDQVLGEGAFPDGLAVMGALAGAGAISLAVSRRKRSPSWQRPALGFLAGGAFGACVVFMTAAFPLQGWGWLAALTLWGALMALLMFWWEKVSAKRWLRLLSSPGEDRIFPLLGHSLTLGKSEINDIPLQTFHEIYPYHCRVQWVDNHYEIVENDQGGIVLVNFRQIEQQALKPGDLVKIGSAVLQYGEAR